MGTHAPEMLHGSRARRRAAQDAPAHRSHCRSGPLAIMTQQPNASEAEAAKLAEWGKRLQEIGGKCNRFEQELLKEVPSVRPRLSAGAAASHARACACVNACNAALAKERAVPECV